MSDEPLPSIAILGAGPTGIETALYARFLGYPVTVFEQGSVCENVRDWGHVRLFTPWRMNCSSLGIAALKAQDPAFTGFPADQSPTGDEWVERYLAPLAESDLVVDSIRTGTTVISVSRDGQLPLDNRGVPERGQSGFRLLFEHDGGEEDGIFDFVIDATGTWNQPAWMGNGGAPAIGERALRRRLVADEIPPGKVYTCWTLFPEQIDLCEGDTFVVVGAGHTAATNLAMLEAARQNREGLRCIWLTRSPDADAPVAVIPDDPLPGRRELAERVNGLARDADWADWRPGSVVRSVSLDNEGFRLSLVGRDGEIRGDHLLANTGFEADFGIVQALQVQRCQASGGPAAWAASVADTPADCMQQRSPGPGAVATTEPGFFVLGAKSYGRDSRFLFATGLQQIRDAFRIIGDRDALDLYATMVAAGNSV